MVNPQMQGQLAFGVSPEEQMEDETTADDGEAQDAVPEVGAPFRARADGLFRNAQTFERRLPSQAPHVVPHRGEQPGVRPFDHAQVTVQRPSHLLADILGILPAKLKVRHPYPVGEGAGAGVKLLKGRGFSPLCPLQ